jgi:hypothetical protein
MNYIYIISSNQTTEALVKLGVTNNPLRRIKTYLVHNPHAKLLHVYEFENAKEIESKFHNNFKSFQSEWYPYSYLEIMVREMLIEMGNEITEQFVQSSVKTRNYKNVCKSNREYNI